MATRANNLLAMVTNLTNEAFVQALVDESYGFIFGEAPDVRLAVNLTKGLMKNEMDHIGGRDGAHASWVGAERNLYDDVDTLFGTSDADGRGRAQLLIYTKIACASTRVASEGTESQRDKWSDWLEEFQAVEALDMDRRLGTLRERVVTTCRTRVRGGAGGGAAAAAAPAVGGNMSVRVHQPKLLKMPNSIDEGDKAALYRHLLLWVNSSTENHTEDAVNEALVGHKLAKEFSLFVNTRGGLSEADWNNMAWSERVVKWIKKTMKTLDSHKIADNDLEAALSFKMDRGMTVEAYLTELDHLITTALLSYHIAYEQVPPALSTEPERCKLIVNGLLPKLKSSMKSEHSTTVNKSRVTGGHLPPGYSVTGFTDKDLVVALATSFASDLRIDGGTPMTPPRTGRHDRDDDGAPFTKKTANRVTKERAAFVAMAIQKGEATPEGYGMVAAETCCHRAGDQQQVHAIPCMSHEAVKTLTFPPLLIAKNGKPADIKVQLCKFGWRNQKCTTPGCERDHITRDEFLKMLAEGKEPGTPVETRKRATEPAASGSASVASSSDVSSSSLEEKRVALLEEQVKSQTETLVALSGKLDILLKGSGGAGAESEAVKQRRMAVAQRRANIAVALREVHDEEEALKAFTSTLDDVNAAVAGSSGNMVISPDAESFWTEDVLADAGAMLSKAMATGPTSKQTMVKASSKKDDGSGLPLSTLKLFHTTLMICVMWDTGCSPSGLVSLNTIHAWIKKGADISISYFVKPKTISGVGPDPVLIVGTCTLSFYSADGRPIIVSCGVMSNGSTGACDVLIGNYHMRHDWDFLINTKHFTLQTPPDCGGKLEVPIDWRLARDAQSTGKSAHAVFSVDQTVESSC